MQKYGYCVALMCFFPVGLAALNDETAESRTLIERAVRAYGGADALKKLDVATWKAKGTAFADNKEIGLTVDAQSQGLDRGRLDAAVVVDNKTLNARVVWNDDKGWVRLDQQTNDFPPEAVKLLRDVWYALRVAEMIMPLQDAETKLSPLGELKIGEREAVGVKVNRKDRPDLDLYFDKSSNLSARCSLLVKESAEGQEKSLEIGFGEYKDFDGLKHFTKIVIQRDGKKLMDIELSEVKLAEKLDENAFDRP